MRIVDFYPSQGSFSPGETVTLLIELESFGLQDILLRIFIQHLTELLTIVEQTVQLAHGEHTLEVDWMPPPKPAGYSARLAIYSAEQESSLHAITAFDILSHWTDFPRYGFLTNFSGSRPYPESVLKKLTRFHINGLQFYDWQYRHDQLLAPTEEYTDPLGRELSLASVRQLVEADINMVWLLCHIWPSMPPQLISGAHILTGRSMMSLGIPLPLGKTF